ncbi:PRC-barrel domain-containing protein [Halomonas sp. McH1-25]|uniref:PRC-barrel domain-containing protein n=1 Tax=unclassified Halomonas TaxID=2609666 RepID=UPI001EF6F401|nr:MULTISPECIES: PRC-barrel domain-containing protein [unclassified Halomonas]MCG7599962.1 PRC-barrel domain-containing protein [Halomonas sp. McH1-25]MCP1343373.1 PRC-barrel domain-containing protein [Halomonas sp. FL8]MCP1360470.1 PRC-barrel domain-containing protein [Halomonas sp. BBD45]MCP1363854.1 PRC-barrel domain-containing protein [Halomonas sp. BBD48]
MKRTALAIAIGALSGSLSMGILAQESGQTEPDQGQMGQAEGQQTQQESMTQQDPSGSQQGGQQGDLMSMPVSEIEGMQVVNQDGQELGEVERVAISNQDNQVYAIVSVGGFLGIGDESVALPIEEMNLQKDHLVLQTNRSEDELQQSAEDYNEEDYQAVEGDTALSDAASGVASN